MVTADFSGNFTNPDNCHENDIGVITGEGQYQDKKNLKGEVYKQLTIQVEINGKSLEHSPRMLEGKKLVKAWGKETEDWVGKKFTCKIVHYRSYGQEKSCVELEPLENKPMQQYGN